MKKILVGLTSLFVLSTTAWAGDYYYAGVSHFKKGDFNKATTNFEQTVKTSPNNVNARYYLAQCYLTKQRTPEAINQYNRIILLAPSSDAARLSQKGLSLINESFTAGSASRTIANDALAKYKDNYLEYVTPAGKITKWTSFPLKVYVKGGKQKNDALMALAEWQNKTKNLVSFEYTNTPLDAKITISFINKLEETSTKEAFVAGLSKPYYQGDNLTKSEITILAIDPATGLEMESSRLRSTITHEVGHSLGLNGHSPNEKDMMYYSSDSSKGLTQRDINTISLLYKIDKKAYESTTKTGTDVELQQAQEYVKKVPGKSIGWAKLGDYYSNKKMYSDAIKNYNKALSLEPNNANLYALAGVAYSDSGDSKNAYTNLKKACDLDKTNTVYLYKFCFLCASTNQKAIGQEYLDALIKANPQANASNEIKSLKQYYK